MPDSSGYYTENASQFYMDNVHVDMTAFHEEFLSSIPRGGLLLDAGCGSGRDTREFLSRGFSNRRIATFMHSNAVPFGIHLGNPESFAPVQIDWRRRLAQTVTLLAHSVKTNQPCRRILAPEPILQPKDKHEHMNAKCQSPTPY